LIIFLWISVQNVSQSKRVSWPELNPSDVVLEHVERHEDGLHLGGHLDRRHGLHRRLLLQDLVSQKWRRQLGLRWIVWKNSNSKTNPKKLYFFVNKIFSDFFATEHF
jgi:hypothetical protein